MNQNKMAETLRSKYQLVSRKGSLESEIQKIPVYGISLDGRSRSPSNRGESRRTRSGSKKSKGSKKSGYNLPVVPQPKPRLNQLLHGRNISPNYIPKKKAKRFKIKPRNTFNHPPRQEARRSKSNVNGAFPRPSWEARIDPSKNLEVWVTLEVRQKAATPITKQNIPKVPKPIKRNKEGHNFVLLEKKPHHHQRASYNSQTLYEENIIKDDPDGIDHGAVKYPDAVVRFPARNFGVEEEDILMNTDARDEKGRLLNNPITHMIYEKLKKIDYVLDLDNN